MEQRAGGRLCVGALGPAFQPPPVRLWDLGALRSIFGSSGHHKDRLPTNYGSSLCYELVSDSFRAMDSTDWRLEGREK